MLLDAGGDLHANGHTCWEAAADSVSSRKVMKYPKNHINYRVPYDEVFKFCMKNGAEDAERYLEIFCAKSGTEKRYVQKWLPMVAAAQMAKGNAEECAALEKWTRVVEYH
jgi:hypothetical protein